MKHGIKVIAGFSLFLLTAVSGFGVVVSTASAASLGVLCMNSSTKVITVEKACIKGQVRLAGTNLPTTLFVNSKCYTQSGSSGNAASSGKVAVALSCKSGYVVVSDGFDTEDNTRANPKLSSKTLMFSSGLKGPTGEQFETQGETNLYYTLSASIVCCPGT